MIEFDQVFTGENDVWFTGTKDNFLYSMDENCRIKLISMLENKRDNVDRLNPYCIKHEDCIICLPSRGKAIILFNVRDNTIRKIDVDIDEARVNLAYGQVIKHELWTYSTSACELIVFDLNSGIQTKRIKVFEKNEELFSGNAILYDKSIFCVSPVSKEVAVIDTEDDTVKYINFGIGEKGISTIYIQEDMMWLSGYKNNIYICSIEEEKCVRTINLDDRMKWIRANENGMVPRFRNVHSIDEKRLLYVPKITDDFLSDDLLLVDIKSNSAKSIDMSVKGTSRKPGEIIVYTHYKNDSIYVLDYLSGGLISINSATNEKKNIRENFDEKYMGEFWKKQQNKGLLMEKEICTLTNFIDAIYSD